MSKSHTFVEFDQERMPAKVAEDKKFDEIDKIDTCKSIAIHQLP